MRIIVTGTRGIPNISGGVETHCEELYPRIVKMGHEVIIIRRTSYLTSENKIQEYKGIKFKDLFAPRKKSFEAIIHTFLAVVWARFKSPDILHVHSVGPSILVLFARMLGLKVVVTNHGPDYDRQKWGKAAKTLLKLGEIIGTRFANKVIVISNVINSILVKKYNRKDCYLIYNGVNIPEKSSNIDYLEKLGLKNQKYIMAIGRFVEEKGFHDLIEAYMKLKDIDYKLVLVGDADHETAYSKKLKKTAKKNDIILTGYIKGDKLNQVFSNASLFVMPSYHEGLPIVLLEALSYNLNVLISDIPANLEVALDADHYFKTGNVDELAEKIEKRIKNIHEHNYSDLIKNKYNWDLIADQTLGVYTDILQKK